MYRTLDSLKIVETIDQLHRRIEARFPASSLARVCGELGRIARDDRTRAEDLAKPNWWLRTGVGLVLLVGASLLIYLAAMVATKEASSDLFGTLQGIDSAFNIIVLSGAAIFFMVSLEARTKRNQALLDLHGLRSLIHVIDMHQLTKDPSALMPGGQRTDASPARTMTPFELTRYLDYCSEMLSLTAKLAALYAQSSTDEVVIDTVNDLEQLSANLSQKIWQKITLLDQLTRLSASRLPGTLLEAPGSAGAMSPAPLARGETSPAAAATLETGS